MGLKMLLSEKEQEEFEERIAIMEYKANIPNDEVDGIALSYILNSINKKQLTLSF